MMANGGIISNGMVTIYFKTRATKNIVGKTVNLYVTLFICMFVAALWKLLVCIIYGSKRKFTWSDSESTTLRDYARIVVALLWSQVWSQVCFGIHFILFVYIQYSNSTIL